MLGSGLCKLQVLLGWKVRSEEDRNDAQRVGQVTRESMSGCPCFAGLGKTEEAESKFKSTKLSPVGGARAAIWRLWDRKEDMAQGWD